MLTIWLSTIEKMPQLRYLDLGDCEESNQYMHLEFAWSSLWCTPH